MPEKWTGRKIQLSNTEYFILFQDSINLLRTLPAEGRNEHNYYLICKNIYDNILKHEY